MQDADDGTFSMHAMAGERGGEDYHGKGGSPEWHEHPANSKNRRSVSRTLRG